MPDSPNFLSCPAFPELPPPEESKAFKKTKLQKMPTPKRPGSGRRWMMWVIVLVVVGGILAATLPAAFALGHAFVAAQSAKQDLTQAEAKAKSQDFASAQVDLSDAAAQAQVAHDALDGVGFWRYMPYVGTQVASLENASMAAENTINGLSDLLKAAASVQSAFAEAVSAEGELQSAQPQAATWNDLSPDDKRLVMQRLSDALPDIREASDQVDLAVEWWNQIDTSQLAPPIKNALAPLAQALPTLQQSLHEAVPLIEVGVPLAGYPDPSNMLLVLQNPDELRPGGGFIGNVGILATSNGDIENLFMGDVYAVDQPATGKWKQTPPAPIQTYLGVTDWFLRDANWSPDFPTDADRMLDFYNGELSVAGAPNPQPPQGVLAVDPALFASLLKITGPISADGITFDANNFVDTLEYQVEIGFLKQGTPVDERKRIVADLGGQLVDKLRALPSSKWPDVINAVTQALTQKDILVYSRNPQLLSQLDALGWTGRAKGTNGDFLWVVDGNLGALKTDGVMDKHVTYKLDATDPNNPTATVTLTYDNTNSNISWRYTRYRSYTRIYVPDGATLISSSGAMKNDLNVTGGTFVPGTVDVSHELGKTVFGAFWSIEPGKTGSLSFTYRLPSTVFSSPATGTYHLDWPKQAGASNTKLTLDLSFGKTVQSASPPEDKSQWGDDKYEYQTDSLLDREFDVKF